MALKSLPKKSEINIIICFQSTKQPLNVQHPSTLNNSSVKCHSRTPKQIKKTEESFLDEKLFGNIVKAYQTLLPNQEDLRVILQLGKLFFFF